MSSEEKGPDIKIVSVVSVICILCIMFLIMDLLFTSYYSSVSVVLGRGLSAVALAILLLAIQVRYQAEQK